MTFQPVGVTKENVTLSKFIPKDGDETTGWMYNTDYLATVKNTGAVDKKYGYISPYWAEQSGDPTTLGWHLYSNLQNEDYFGERFDDEKIPFATGIYIYSNNKNMTVQFSGSVLSDDYGIPLAQNANTFTGVICPKDITLKDLEPTNGDETTGWLYNTDYLATLKTNGSVDKKYGYISPYWSEQSGDPTTLGWHLYSNLQNEDYFGERCDDIPLTAGQGFYVYVNNQNIELVVPSAIP